jgi:hypothetical protein
MSKRARIGLFIALSLLPLAAGAQTCAGLSAYLDDLRDAYRKYDEKASLKDGQAAAAAIRGELTDSATAALDCRCPSAYQELLNSASFARQAEAADNMKDLNYRINRSILSYNNAVDLLNHCPH